MMPVPAVSLCWLALLAMMIMLAIQGGYAHYAVLFGWLCWLSCLAMLAKLPMLPGGMCLLCCLLGSSVYAGMLCMLENLAGYLCSIGYTWLINFAMLAGYEGYAVWPPMQATVAVCAGYADWNFICRFWLADVVA
jgi:hypothetical protein